MRGCLGDGNDERDERDATEAVRAACWTWKVNS